MAPPIDWHQIYGSEFIYAPGCYTTCGGYCCRNFHGEAFRILDKDKVTLPIMDCECAYYRSIGGIRNIDSVRTSSFTLKNGALFTMHYLECGAKGLCDPHCARPLICRIYPLVPVVDWGGEIIGFDYAALADLFYRDPKNNHPCTLVRTKEDEIKEGLCRSLQPFLRHPKFVFTLKSLELIVRRLREKQNAYLDEMKDPAEKLKFLRRFEWNIYSMAPWRDAGFADGVQDIYDGVCAHWGEAPF